MDNSQSEQLIAAWKTENIREFNDLYWAVDLSARVELWKLLLPGITYDQVMEIEVELTITEDDLKDVVCYDGSACTKFDHDDCRQMDVAAYEALREKHRSILANLAADDGSHESSSTVNKIADIKKYQTFTLVKTVVCWVERCGGLAALADPDFEEPEGIEQDVAVAVATAQANLANGQIAPSHD